MSAQSLTSETAKPATPPGDEVWAQKCHELDFQVIRSQHFISWSSSVQNVTCDGSRAQFYITFLSSDCEFVSRVIDFQTLQVALLKEERSNLMVENEELYGKVREAQTLSRKDSVKAKALETEVDHLKDEFDRLRALYVNTRDHVDNMEVGMETLGCVT